METSEECCPSLSCGSAYVVKPLITVPLSVGSPKFIYLGLKLLFLLLTMFNNIKETLSVATFTVYSLKILYGK